MEDIWDYTAYRLYKPSWAHILIDYERVLFMSGESQTPSQIYREDRKILIEGKREESKAFYNAMLTLSGGALGLSITFVKDIIGATNSPKAIFLLAASWIYFICALTLVLVLYRASVTAFAKQIELLDSYYADFLKGNQDKHKSQTSEQITARPRNTWVSKLVSNLDWIAIICFIGGVICLAIFSIINL